MIHDPSVMDLKRVSLINTDVNMQNVITDQEETSGKDERVHTVHTVQTRERPYQHNNPRESLSNDES